MTARHALFGLCALFLPLVPGCGPRFDPPPRPAVVSHLDISQKKAYIDKTRSTLKVFHAAALDLRRRVDYRSRSELADEVQRFIDLQVEPIVDDFEAGSNLETRVETAELQLLCGMIYFELGEYWDLRSLLKEIEHRYAESPEVRKAALDRNEFGFRNLDEGIRTLRQRLYLVGENIPRADLF